MSYFDDASLAFLPSGAAGKDGKAYSIKPTDGDGDFDFSRGSNLAATRVNSDGLIEKGRENLLLQSNQFDTTWTPSNTTLTSGQSGYDGTSNAWLLETNGTQFASNIQSLSSSGVTTQSIYAKAGTLDFIILYAASAASPRVWFNLSNGTIGTTTGGAFGASIQDVGNGWYRCSFVNNDSTTNFRIYPTGADNTFTATAGNILIQSAQLESGLVSTPYIPTTTTSAQAGILENTPRLDYSGGATCPSVLLEPSRTNLITQSEYFGDSYWTKSGSSVVGGFTSPEGLSNAYKLVEDTSTGFHRAYIIYALADGSFSFYVKKGERRYIQLGAGNTGSLGITTLFDLDSGVVVSSTTGNAVIENISNDWYKCSVSGSGTGGATSLNIYICNGNIINSSYSYTGDGTSGVYIYGAQLELGSYPTSYIPTYGTSVTRAADSCSKTGISNLIGQTEGTMFVEYDQNRIGQLATRRIMSLTDGDIYNRIVVYISSSNKIDFYVRNSSGNLFLGTSISTDTKGNHKIAAAYKDGDYTVYLDGVEIISGAGTSGTIPACNRIDLGSQITANDLFEPINQAILFPTRLTNSELAALTTI